MSPYDPTALVAAADKAPEAGFSPVNYGKLTVNVMAVSWKDKVATKRVLSGGDQPANGETLELEFSVNVSELNPALEFSYTRNVPMRKSGRILSNWQEIVLPSLEKVFGGDGKWAKAMQAGPYVEVEDVNDINGAVSKKGKVLGVPKFLRAFKNIDECKAAREARFGPSGTSGTAPASTEPDAETVGKVKSLIKSVGEETALTILTDKKPFGDYDPGQLMALAKA